MGQYKLYADLDGDQIITAFYSTADPSFNPAGKTLVKDNAERGELANYSLYKPVNNITSLKYKWTDPNIVERPDSEIKVTKDWLEARRDQLILIFYNKIRDYTQPQGEAKVHYLVGRKAMGDTLPANDMDYVNEFDTFRDDEKTIFLNELKDEGIHKLKSNSDDTDAVSLEIKKISGLSVGDVVRCVDYSPTNPKDQTRTVDSIDGNDATLDTHLGNTTKYSKNSTYVYKIA